MRRLAALAVAIVILAAACGDAGTSAEVELAPVGSAPAQPATPTTTPTTPPTTGLAPAEGGLSEQAPDPEETTSADMPPDVTQPAEEPVATGPPIPSDWPAVQVLDLAGGEVSLPSMAPADLPTLLWFWAPH